ncbi:arylamine N-acetyltransferase 2 [Penicillium robsamsonii]|uniref:arylamine N-acetyltransferase 2 n=1 Tax=Penicillium robsamsonii TaxID=1792511 RepID=UPI002546B45E|nr:arylamine N-acetyltransferase 2 [Penicillium robsamsonii]KAJ5816589.1 arylamine N-acetyltransferase 2 [Penicillium robsamsonii]
MSSDIDWFLRPTYSPDQLNQYFDRISFPRKYRESPIVKNGPSIDNQAALYFLKALQRYQLAASIYAKIVDVKSNRGGYCMENNALFGTVLRSLGYNAISVGGRVNEAVQPMSASKNWNGPKYQGWNHMINVVAIGEQKYLVDVGFGSNGPHQPIPLVHGFTFNNVGEQAGRLIYEPITQQMLKSQSLWQYEINNGDETWTPAYCFTEVEFLPEDFTIINYYMSQSRGSWFTFHVVCVRMLLDDECETIVGDLTLFNDTLKRRIGATSEVLQCFTSEEERMVALEKYFNIHLSRADQANIRFTASEIL